MTMTETSELTTAKIADRYLAVWSEPDPAARRAAARPRALAHDDVNGLAQVARRFPEDFLAVARADAVERFQDRLLDGIDLGDVAKLATAPLGKGREMASRIEKIHIADVIRISRDTERLSNDGALRPWLGRHGALLRLVTLQDREVFGRRSRYVDARNSPRN